MQILNNFRSVLWAQLLISFIIVTLVYAQQGDQLRVLVFTRINQVLNDARKAKADILAPKAFGEGMELYNKAKTDFNKGRKMDDVRRSLNNAINRYYKAMETSRLANTAFGTVMQARNDAISAEAISFAPALFTKAEIKFTEATGTLEDGDLKDAKGKAFEAEKLYRDAELKAIKVNYLDEAYALLKLADEKKVNEYAPETLKLAKALVKESERELNEDRYDTDKARILARRAKREAKHAHYLAKTIREMKSQDQSWEHVLLNSEKPLAKISTVLNTPVTFESGVDKPTETLIKNIKETQNFLAKVENELYDSAQLNTLLEERNSELEGMKTELTTKLGDVELKKSLLALRLERQAKIRALYDEASNLFTGEIAVFVREGSNMIIRTVGLTFPVGKATIDPKYNEFLTRVRKAIDLFPHSTLSVEGHTDSYGSDETNWRLSMERAEAVKYHLVKVEGIDTNRIQSVGYGENNPIASNETQEGRARNRRIEVIIRPNIDEGS